MRNGVVTLAEAEDAGVPAVEVRKLSSRGALRSHGHGVYTHCAIPPTWRTQPTVAVALAGNDAFLHRESVFHAMGLGQFNPPKIRVATPRRVRRTLPDWMELENRRDVPPEDLVEFEGITVTTIQRALGDLRLWIPPDRWESLLHDAARLELVTDSEAAQWQTERL